MNYYKALVNGEDTTIGVKAGESVAVALFVNNSYTGDYISALGTQVDALILPQLVLPLQLPWPM